MAEFMETSADLIQREKRRGLLRRPGEIAANGGQRRYPLASLIGLAPQRARPGAASLGRSGKEIEIKQADVPAIFFFNLINFNFRMINRDIISFLELKPVE